MRRLLGVALLLLVLLPTSASARPRAANPSTHFSDCINSGNVVKWAGQREWVSGNWCLSETNGANETAFHLVKIGAGPCGELRLDFWQSGSSPGVVTLWQAPHSGCVTKIILRDDGVIALQGSSGYGVWRDVNVGHDPTRCYAAEANGDNGPIGLHWELAGADCSAWLNADVIWSTQD